MPRRSLAKLYQSEFGGYSISKFQQDLLAGLTVAAVALPLAPRLHERRLWLDEAASGLFGFIHLDSTAFEEVAFCPGWLAGLAFVDGYAVVAIAVRAVVLLEELDRALEAGVKGDEIYHTLLLLVSTIGFPAVSAALSWARETVEKKS